MNKVIKAWGGFCEDKLQSEPAGGPDGQYFRKYAIFRTRTEAKKGYDDVRRIHIVWEARG